MKVLLPRDFSITTMGVGYSLDRFIPAHIGKDGKETKPREDNISYPASILSACTRYAELYHDEETFDGIREYAEAINKLTIAVTELTKLAKAEAK